MTNGGNVMNRIMVRIAAVLAIVLLVGAFAKPVTVHASDDEQVAIAAMSDEASFVHDKAWAAGIVIAVVAAAGALSMGLVIWKTIEGIARQPEAEGKNGDDARPGVCRDGHHLCADRGDPHSICTVV